MLIDLNFVVQVYKWASGTKQFNSLTDKVKLKNMFWENELKQGSCFFHVLQSKLNAFYCSSVAVKHG